MGTTEYFKKLLLINNKLNYWHKFFIILLIITIIFEISNYYNPRKREGFTQEKKFVSYSDPTQIFDDFYNSLYDSLGLDNSKNTYEIAEILKETTKYDTKEEDLEILDVGCGMGHHANILQLNNLKTTGLDISPAVINTAKKNYPNINFILGDALNKNLFKQKQFTHILCLYFTIYYIKDKKQFFSNCYNWLNNEMGYGYLAIHLVNRQKFDPMIKASNPFIGVNIQQHAKKRITQSVVKFKNYDYKANFDIIKDNATFTEDIKNNKTKKIRQNIHKFYMERQHDILKIAKSVGFEVIGHVDLNVVDYEYQYIYILKKK